MIFELLGTLKRINKMVELFKSGYDDYQILIDIMSDETLEIYRIISETSDQAARRHMENAKKARNPLSEIEAARTHLTNAYIAYTGLIEKKDNAVLSIFFPNPEGQNKRYSKASSTALILATLYERLSEPNLVAQYVDESLDWFEKHRAVYLDHYGKVPVLTGRHTSYVLNQHAYDQMNEESRVLKKTCNTLLTSGG